jgi:hypothetical protein
LRVKIETCASVDPVQRVWKQVFNDQEHLCVLHKGKNENPHWYFQGEYPEDEVKGLSRIYV